jgi:glycosyltransferase involved in cell wall biosynthesis
VVSRSILYVIGSLDVGGTERHLSTIAPRLKQRGWSPRIYCITRRGRQSKQVEEAGVEVIGPPWEINVDQTPIKKVFRLAASCLKLFFLLLTERPQIAHFFLPLAYIIGAPLALIARTPYLIMSRRSLNLYQRKHPMFRRLEFWLHGRMTTILCNSEAIFEQLINLENCNPDKVRVIYNGLVLQTGSTSTRPSEIRRSQQPALVFIIVANLIPYKGHSDLIDAFGIICKSLPSDWTLLCVGRDDGIRAKLETKVSKLGLASHVQFLGERGDVSSLLNEADIAILCSHEEGFSNAILEGMAAGLPIVATDVGGNAEAVVHQQTGLIVPAHDPKALGAAILELALDPAKSKKLGIAARKRVEMNFSMDQCLTHYEKIYHESANAHSDGGK